MVEWRAFWNWEGGVVSVCGVRFWGGKIAKKFNVSVLLFFDCSVFQIKNEKKSSLDCDSPDSAQGGEIYLKGLGENWKRKRGGGYFCLSRFEKSDKIQAKVVSTATASCLERRK